MDLKNCILYEDNHLLIVNKPSGIAVLPNDGMEDMTTIMKDTIKRRDKKPGKVFLHPVHRIDRWVSGIVVFAKTSKALSRINNDIREKLWKKKYIAELIRPLAQEQGELCHYLCKRQYIAEVYLEPRPYSKEAILHFSHLRGNFYEVELKTGRYHQIRAQMAFMNSPITGDQKYGAPKAANAHIHLHHANLVLIHPITKEQVIIDSKPPFM